MVSLIFLATDVTLGSGLWALGSDDGFETAEQGVTLD